MRVATAQLSPARWILALQSFDFELTFIKGSSNVLADALSWNPVTAHEPSDDERCESSVCFILKQAPVDLKEIAEQSIQDPEMQQLKSAIRDGWKDSHKNEVPSNITVSVMS